MEQSLDHNKTSASAYYLPSLMTAMSTECEMLYVHDKSLQSCPAICDPMDCSPPGSSVQGILQARVLEWAARSFSRGPSRPGD